MESMEKVLRCDCGFEARGEHEDGLVAEVQRHAWETHGMALSHDQALLLAFRAELDATSPPCRPVSEAGHDPSHDAMFDREEERELARRAELRVERAAEAAPVSMSKPEGGSA